MIYVFMRKPDTVLSRDDPHCPVFSFETPSFSLAPLSISLETCDRLLCTAFVVVVLPSDCEGAVPIRFLAVRYTASWHVC